MKKGMSIVLILTVFLSIVSTGNMYALAASFTPRLSAPDRSGYYSNNTSINPYSVNDNAGGGNCTWYAWGRAYEILGSRPKINTIGNACTWYPNNQSSGNYSYGSTPKLGAIACWSGGSSGAGHVAVVEQINDNGTVVVSESSWTATDWWFRTRTMNSNGYYTSSLSFQGYIYIGDFDPTPPTQAFLTTDAHSYAVDETVTFTCNTNGNVNVLWIYCPNGEELHYDFDNSNSIQLCFGMTGHFQALVQAWNGVGSLCSERIDFVVGPPTYAILTTDCKSYAVDEIATFTCNTDGNANVLWIYCPNGDELHYDFDDSDSIKLGFGMLGHYQALVQAWNGVGSLCSEIIDFVVGSPTYATLTTDSQSYAVDETATFTCNTDGNVNVLWIYCPNGERLHYDFDDSDSIKLSFGMLGHYQALVQAWNGVGSLCSEIIDFVVGSPTYAILTTDQSNYSVNQTISFVCNTDGNVNVLWIYYPNGESVHYSFDNSSTIELSLNMPGHYQALVQAWNGVGSLCSEKIDFSINAMPGDVDGDGDIGLKDVVQITRYLAGGWDVTMDLTAADVNKDGEVNLKDAVLLRRYLAGGWDIQLA